MSFSLYENDIPRNFTLHLGNFHLNCEKCRHYLPDSIELKQSPLSDIFILFYFYSETIIKSEKNLPIF